MNSHLKYLQSSILTLQKGFLAYSFGLSIMISSSLRNPIYCQLFGVLYAQTDSICLFYIITKQREPHPFFSLLQTVFWGRELALPQKYCTATTIAARSNKETLKHRRSSCREVHVV